MQPLLTVRDLCARLSISRSRLYSLLAGSDLPKPIYLSPPKRDRNGVLRGEPRWRPEDVDAWIASRAEAA